MASNGNNMALSSVHLNSDVYLVCLTQALSTEKEEIMGLLLGEWVRFSTASFSCVMHRSLSRHVVVVVGLEVPRHDARWSTQLFNLKIVMDED